MGIVLKLFILGTFWQVKSLNTDADAFLRLPWVLHTPPVSYTHLTLPTNREV